MSTLEVPGDAIQRVLFIASSVHVYNIPPLTSTKGYTAATVNRSNAALITKLLIYKVDCGK